MKPESVSTSIVLLGQFELSVFLPKKLRDLDVLDASEAGNADFVQFVPGHILEYSLSWGQISVSPFRVQVQTDQTPYVRSCDLLRSIFGHVAPASKLVAMGINFQCHYRLDHAYQRDRIGTALLPTKPWGQWGEAVQHQIDTIPSSFRHGGLVSATMQMKRLDDIDGAKGHTDVNVQPSTLIPDTGIYFAVNNHFQGADKLDMSKVSAPDVIDCRTLLLGILESRFDTILAESRAVIDGVLEGKT